MPWRVTTLAIALHLWPASAAAIERIVLQADEVIVAGAAVQDPKVELDLSGTVPRLSFTALRATLIEPAAVSLDTVQVTCGEIVIREPRFACKDGRLSAKGGPTRAIDMRIAAALDSARGAVEVEGTGLALAGGSVRFAGAVGRTGWSAHASAQALRIAQMRELLSPWFALPAEYSTQGHLAAQVDISGKAGAIRMRLDARSTDFDLTNEAGSVVAEKVTLRVRAQAHQARGSTEISSLTESSAGQALAGPVLLDFGTNPLKVSARAHLAQGVAELQDISIEQRDLLSARATARLQVGGKPFVRRAHADLASIRFPAAYRSFLQIALAATDFGTLEAAGSASGSVDIVNDAIERVDLELGHIDFVDERTQFFMNDVQGELHWAPDAIGSSASSAAVNLVQLPDSTLAWSRMRAYGLSGGTARLDFRARGTSFALTREARLPVFDGAIVVHSLAARQLGSAAAELDFDADIEPISLALLAKAFGWPQLAGQLSGRIPGLTYRNKVLALNGDVTAQVFDGTITGRNFRLQDPLGSWPRLFADVTARRLDLQQVTSTFSTGSITGRLDADLAHLELFNWSPVAFDARLYSTPNDRSPRRISQKAIGSISSIGGGSGGVTKALQSGLLRFFEEFSYDRIGIACQLRNDVCLMSGIEPAGAGYYLVKGRGLPRIDIIGNQGRVDWPRLLEQIVAGMQSDDVIVR